MNRLFIFLVCLNFGSSAVGQSQDSLKLGDTLSRNNHKVYEFFQVSQMPVFPGGEAELYKYIAKEVRYPTLALENHIEGKIIIEFVIQKDGSVTDVRPMGTTRLGWGCEEEAIRVVKNMPAWEPGYIRNEPIAVMYRLPIKFEISDPPPAPPKKNKSKKTNPTSLPTNKPQNPNPYD